MSDFGASVLINVPAQQVFEYASRAENMPEYLEGVALVQPLDGGRVRITGSRLDAEAWLDVDQDHLMMRWVAEGEGKYMGHLTVTPMDAFTSKAEVHVICDSPGQEQRIQAELDSAMEKIREICEANAMRIPSDLQLGSKRYMS
jgi:uncharacterized protein YndB with AHSA1/START domain